MRQGWRMGGLGAAGVCSDDPELCTGPIPAPGPNDITGFQGGTGAPLYGPNFATRPPIQWERDAELIAGGGLLFIVPLLWILRATR